MNKKLLRFVFAITLIATLGVFATVAGCAGNTTDTVSESDLVLYYIEKEGSTREIFENAPDYDAEKGWLDLTLGKEVDSYDFSEHFKSIEQKTKWSLYLDKMGQEEVPTKVVNLFDNGENFFYITVSSLNDTLIKNYTVRIYKEYTVDIAFLDKNGDNYVPAGKEPFTDFIQQTGASVSEDGVYTLPGDTVLSEVPRGPEVVGYDFDGWFNGDVPAEDTFLTENTVFASKYTARTIEFTLDAAGGDLGPHPNTIGLEYDAEHQLPVPTREGYTFNGWILTRDDSAFTDASGKTLGKMQVADNSALKADWTVNEYGIRFITSGEAGGSVSVSSPEGEQSFVPQTGEGEEQARFDYGTELTFTVTPPETYTYLIMHWHKYGEEENWTLVEGDRLVMPACDVEVRIIYGHYEVRISNDDSKGSVAGEGFYTAGDEVKVTAAPKTGYLFDAWIRDEERIETAEYSFEMPKGNVDLSVEWEAVIVTATLKPGNGEEDSSVRLTYGDVFTLPVPERYGYEFIGWQTEEGEAVSDKLGNGIDVSKFTGDVTLCAAWNPLKVKIKFELGGGNGGPDFTDRTVDFDSIIELPEPTRTGYAFAGWKKDGESGIFDGKVDFVEETTLTAQWTPVTVQVNLHMSKSEEAYETKKAVYDARVELGVPERTGYTFKGWYKSDDDAPVTDDDGIIARSEFTAETDVYAQWVPVTVTAKLDGAEPGSARLTFDESFTLPVPVKTGYKFGGWQHGGTPVTDEKGESLAVSKFTEDVELTAKWTPVEATLAFSAGEGASVEGGAANVRVVYDAKFTLPSATRTGYDFIHWTDSEGRTFNAGTEYTSDFIENDTLTAVWEAKKITVTYNEGEGAVIGQKTQQLTYGQPAQLQIPTRSGYLFDGWKYNGDKICGADGKVEAVKFTENVTLEAVWKTTDVEVTLVANGGKFADGETEKTVTIRYGEEFTLEVPQYAGNVFVGWFRDDEKITGSDGKSIGPSTIEQNVPLTAKWEPAEMTITLDPGEGTLTGSKSVSVYFGQTDVALGVAERTGYYFTGWKNGSSKVTGEDGILEEVTFAGSVTLTAEWEVRYYFVSLSVETAGQGTVSGANRYAYGSEATVTAAAAAGFRFTGWYNSDGELISTDNPYKFTVTDAVTYIAHFAEGGTPVVSEADLKALKADGEYILMNNITLTGSWTPLTFEGGFVGKFDGNGKTISGLKIDRSQVEADGDMRYGLFESIGKGGEVYDLTVSGNISIATYRGNNHNLSIGMIAAVNYGAIENCSVENCSVPDGSSDSDIEIPGIEIPLNRSVGGSYREEAWYKNVYAGGVCGENYGSIKYAKSSVSLKTEYRPSGNAFIGGIAGTNGEMKNGGAVISGCWSNANISVTNENNGGSYYVGAISGQLFSSTIEDCKTEGNINIDAEMSKEVADGTADILFIQNQIYAGGIVAYMNGSSLTRCVSETQFTAVVTGSMNAGGIICQAAASSDISACYADGSMNISCLTAKNGVGKPLVGYVYGSKYSSESEKLHYNVGMRITLKKDGDETAVQSYNDVTPAAFSRALFTETMGFGTYDEQAEDHGANVWIISDSEIKLFIE